MHDIEPYFRWRDHYIAAEDKRSPFYRHKSSEFKFTHKIYNYYVHPQWDAFGSQTLYLKVIYVDYDSKFGIIELIGEWNDCLYNDIMYLKREVLEPMMEKGIQHFILLCDNVLSFHGSDDAYYEEWREELQDMSAEGFVVLLDVRLHVEEELQAMRLQYYLNFGELYNEINWRKLQAPALFELVYAMVTGRGIRVLGD